MSFENLNLNKQLVTGMNALGYTEPTEVQEKTISKMLGGQELVIIAHEKSGKTTACLLAILKKLKRPIDYDARAVLLVPTKEDVLEVMEVLEVLNQDLGLRCKGLYSGGGMTEQHDELFEGVDLIVSTPERMAELHLHKGVFLKRVKILVIDGAERMLEQGLITSVHRVLEAMAHKYQRILVSEYYDHRLEKMVDNYFEVPQFVEIALEETELEVVEHGLYMTPNYRTKQNLLVLLLSNDEWFTKTVVFVNTQVTCQNLYKSLNRRYEGQIASLNAKDFEHQSVANIEEFHASDARILLVLRDEETWVDLTGLPEAINFDIPLDYEVYVDMVNMENYEGEEKPPMITSFATTTELLSVVKIETLLGHKIDRLEFPEGLVIEGTRHRTGGVVTEEEVYGGGGAFHEKKWKNRKEHNYTYHNPKPSEKNNRKK